MKYSSDCLLNQKLGKTEVLSELILKNLFLLFFGFSFCFVSNERILADACGSQGHSVNRMFFGKQRTYENSQGLAAPQLKSNSDPNSVENGVVLLDFYNDACGPCRSMMPAVNSLVQRGYRVSKVNTDRFPDWSSRFNITKIPCFVVIVDGKEVARQVGVTSESRLENMIVQAGGAPMQFKKCTPPEASASRTQIAESAWRGRETKLSVQEIVAGDYVFQEENESGSQLIEVQNGSMQKAQTASSIGTDGQSAVNQVSSSTNLVQNSASRSVLPGNDSSQIARKVLSSTVRIRVNDVLEGGMSSGTGTGTIIDCRAGHALVLTCGHLFKEFRRGDEIKVEIFTEKGVMVVPGRYINHDEDRDLGLISLTVNGPVETTPVAGREYRLQKGMPITTVGCSHCADPTIQTGVITNLNRFLGTPNIEVSAVPVQGRSGGGLFSQDGKLLGVCSAANIEDQEGLFTSLEAIHDYFCSLRMEHFVLSPRNESQKSLDLEEVEIALNDLPRTQKSIVNNELKQAEPETVSLDGSNTVEPIGPVSFHQSRMMPVVQDKPLIGDESPEWPPKWND